MYLNRACLTLLHLDTQRKTYAMKTHKPYKFNKKGEMEVWQLVMIILAILLLLAFIVWYSFLGDSADSLFGKLGDLL